MSAPDLAADPSIRSAILDAVAGLEAEATLVSLVHQRSRPSHEHGTFPLIVTAL